MEIEKSKCCSSKHIIVSVLIMFVVGLFFGVLGYLLGSKDNNTVIENNSTKNAVVNQNDGIEKEEIKNKEEKELENIKDETADWKIYENASLGISFYHPANVILDNESDNGIIIKISNGSVLNISNLSFGVPEYDNDVLSYPDNNINGYYRMIKSNNSSQDKKVLYWIVMDKFNEVSSWSASSVITASQMDEKTIEMFDKILLTFKFTESQDETANWETYKNDQYGFEIKHPENIETYEEEWGIDFAEKGISRNTFFRINVYEKLSELPNNQNELKFEAWIDNQTNYGIFQDKKIFRSGSLTGVEVLDNGIVEYRNILIENDNKFYSIIIQQNQESMDLFNQILSTLKFTN